MRTLTTVFLAMALFVPAIGAAATDLKVTDSRGTEVTVTGAGIDYGGFLGSDKMEDGIRIQQGDDESVKPVRIEVEITLRGGRRATAALLRVDAMKLTGRTELGDYSIDLDKVRAIAPVR